MIKKFLKYIFLTVIVAIAGITLTLIGANSSSLAGNTNALETAGLIVFMFSPLITGGWFWLKRKLALKSDSDDASEKERRAKLRRRFLERERLIDAVDRHRAALTRNVQRAIKTNDYGSCIEDRSDEALEEFFGSIDLDDSAIQFIEARELVFEQLELRETEDRETGFDADNLPFDGHSFENWVAEALIGFGWKAQVTPGSGDQGIDVIAERSGMKLGIQCKLHSSSIGNKAVQEAHAGKSYHKTDRVAVLSNAAYTKSAQDLALMTGVYLLSHHDIPTLFEKVFEEYLRQTLIRWNKPHDHGQRST